MFENKTVLITGGAGFIGSNIAFYLQKQYPTCRVVVFDKFRSEETFSNGNLVSLGHYKNLIGFTGDVITGDIDNADDLQILSDYSFDYIFHQAAISDTRVYDQERVMRTNVNSFFKLLDIARHHHARMIYASSAATYGSLPSPQMIGKEHPENPYGYSKYIMDQVAHNYAATHDISIVGLRFFNVYGEREYFKGKTASMVIQLGHQILSGNAPKLFTGSDTIRRDFVYIEDVINANILACKDEVNGVKVNGVYNVGYGKSRSFQDIADILQIELGTQLGTEYIDNPYTGYQMDTCADISLSQTHLRYEPKVTLEEGIKRYIPYIRQMHDISHTS